MLIVGLTGGIASGKSTVSRMLAEMGAKIVDADILARRAVEPGSSGLEEIVAEFGGEFLLPDGSLDRKKMGARVFSDPEARRRLEEIVHPRVQNLTYEAIQQAQIDGLGAVVLDIPLLIEGGSYEMCHYIWVVWVDRDTQLKRLIERDGLTQEQAGARLAAQMPLDEKVKFADSVIDNSGDPEATRRQVEKLWREVERLSAINEDN